MLGYVWRCLIEARPSAQVSFLLRYLAGALLTAGQAASGDAGFDTASFARGAAGWVACTVAVYVYNGITDRDGDVANGSTRPIASGLLPLPVARLAATALAAFGWLLCWGPGPLHAALALGYLFLGFAYSGRPFLFKNTYYTCSATASAAALLTYAAGAVSAGGHSDLPLALFAGAMSLWMGWVGGIAKDLSDVDGDRLAGRRTWPIVCGEVRVRLLLAGAAVVVGSAFCLAAWWYASRLQLCADAVLAGALLVAGTSLSPTSLGSKSERRRPYRIFVWTQQAAHLALVAV